MENINKNTTKKTSWTIKYNVNLTRDCCVSSTELTFKKHFREWTTRKGHDCR